MSPHRPAFDQPRAPPPGRADANRTEAAGDRPPHSCEKLTRLRPAVYTPNDEGIGPGHVPRFSPGFVQASGDAAVQCSTRSCGADSEPPRQVSQVGTNPARCSLSQRWRQRLQAGISAIPPGITVVQEDRPKHRLPADRREINRTGDALSDYFYPSGLLDLSSQCTRKGPRPALPARRSAPEHGHSFTAALFVTVKQAIASFAANPQRCTICM